ncbi:hypothetical protein DL98DRAFT_536010 [Cadophora sp. DSE1049]|nr:hypothetical protein DL98DRAFT_536010 [Cadophora sp. DSE1049]
MGLDDFFHFDSDEYAAKLAYYSDIEIKQREVTKMRQFISGSCAVGGGLGAAAATGGLSLSISAIGARRAVVANRKLNLIRAELTRRGIVFHKMTMRDRMIPAASALVSLGVGTVVGLELADVSGSSAVVTHDPGTINSDAVGPSTAVDQNTSDANLGNFLVETSISTMASQTSMWILGKFEDPKWEEKVRKAFGCSRLGGTLSLECDSCRVTIPGGRYAHCLCQTCNAEDGGFDLCIHCYHDGQGCKESTEHCLYSFLWSHIPENEGPYVKVGGAGSAGCNVCGLDIMQGPYYHCDECQTDGGYYDVCHKCYELGNFCRNSRHVLKRYYSYDTLQNWSSFYPASQIFCNICKKDIKDTICYHCNTCDDNNYDLCSDCYMTGACCKDGSHLLTKYVEILRDTF